jgi:hypothetical protein
MNTPQGHEVQVSLALAQAFAAQCGNARYGPPTLDFTYRQKPGGNSGGRLGMAAAHALIAGLQEQLRQAAEMVGKPCVLCGSYVTSPNYDALENRLVPLCATCHHRECNHGGEREGGE